jgi:hypothetical protein
MSTIETRGRFRLEPCGARIDEGLTFEEWVAVGAALASAQNATSWGIGDWLFYGEWSYGRRYEEALAVTGLAYQTLADLKYLAGKFETSRRREKLSLSHHREVAALGVTEQEALLDQAEAESWTRERLREAVQQLRLAQRPPAAAAPQTAVEPAEARVREVEPPKDRLVELLLVLSESESVRWRSAATREGLEVEEWIRTVCNGAA